YALFLQLRRDAGTRKSPLPVNLKYIKATQVAEHAVKDVRVGADYRRELRRGQWTSVREGVWNALLSCDRNCDRLSQHAHVLHDQDFGWRQPIRDPLQASPQRHGRANRPARRN